LAGKNPAEALEHYVRPFQQAVACIASTAQFTTDCRNPKDGLEHYLRLSGEPLRVATPRGDVHYQLAIGQRFRIVEDRERDRGPWRANTRSYMYTVANDDGAEILGYHWHPGEQGFNEPHIHVAGHPHASLQHAHLPTGRVTVEAFILLLIREFNVRAQNTGYKKVLEASESRFQKFKDW
jgi:hypothetical protein